MIFLHSWSVSLYLSVTYKSWWCLSNHRMDTRSWTWYSTSVTLVAIRSRASTDVLLARFHLLKHCKCFLSSFFWGPFETLSNTNAPKTVDWLHFDIFGFMSFAALCPTMNFVLSNTKHSQPTWIYQNHCSNWISARTRWHRFMRPHFEHLLYSRNCESIIFSTSCDIW